MNWNSEMQPLSASSKKSNTHLTEEERNVITHLKDGEIKHIDSILASTGLPPAQLATILLNLSLADHIVSLPGNKYQLI
jgi:predicted Rossmann fold nucleotide-binding protein DprA/Smf involved in DNA uptake